ncbi:MAG: hypothetical protein NC548_35220 [Lachnospiraceae bacterium]|nr:hypothetical protein [Lachnospiraceae bacterium]
MANSVTNTNSGMRQTNVNQYKNDQYEYFNNVEMIDPKPKTIKAYLPKYMPMVTPSPETVKIPIDVGNSVNAPDCRVVPPTIVVEQGYLTLSHYDNEEPNFISKAVFIDGAFKVLPMNTFMAEVLYEDPMDIKFIGKV